MALILKHVGRIVPDPEVKRFFSRIDHYYSKISRSRKLKLNLATWKKYPPLPYCVPCWIEDPSDTSFFAYVE